MEAREQQPWHKARMQVSLADILCRFHILYVLNVIIDTQLEEKA